MAMTDAERRDRISELEKLIKEASDAYHNRQPIVTDEVYDAWEDELSELDAVNRLVISVGSPVVSEWAKVKHDNPMGSLNKVNAMEEMTDWINTYAPGESLLLTEKMDGISIQVNYVGGKLKRAATRGDGFIGEDITVNVSKMKGVPDRLPRKITCEIRGEIVLRKSDLSQHFNGDYANTRNAASGISKRYDGRGCEHLTVYFYKVSGNGIDFATEDEQFKFLAELGLLTPWWALSGMWLGIKTPHDIWVDYQQGKRDALDYDIDGLVVRINDMSKQFALGEKDLRPIGAVAFKFAAIMRETVIRGITWQTGGTGRITPVVQFDAVNLLGASVTNASVYNYGYIKELGLDLGSRVLVARANDVIPRVVKVVRSTGTVAPSLNACGSCGATTAWEGEYVICPNRDRCPAQVVGRLSQWVKSLEILEWGDVLLEKLVSSGLALTVPALYRLTEDQLGSLDRMGPKLAAKLLANLHEKKVLALETMLGSLSIPGIGSSTIKAVIDAGYDDVTKIRDVSLGNLSKVSGLGPVKARSLRTWMESNVALLDDLLAVGVSPQGRVTGKFTTLSFCFTGEMKNKRGDLERMVKDLGGEIKSSVTKKLSYLVLADTTTTKASQAQKYGVKCLSEDEFLALVGG
jgi:DNA ligase (NAD+)